MTSNSEALVVVVDDEEVIRDSLTITLSRQQMRVLAFPNAQSALDSPDLAHADCCLIDLRMPGMDGMSLLARLKELNAACPVIVMTGHGNVSTAVDAMRNGAYDFLEKPFENEVVRASVRRAIEKSALSREAKKLREELNQTRSGTRTIMIGESPAIEEVQKRVKSLADTNATVLVTGETGTGKELVARWLHERSSREAFHFVAVNMAALPESLAMGELFGYEKGAYTGADVMRVGKFEYSDGGTLLLDELDSAPLALQAGLLRAIDEKTISRIGGNKPIKVDVRIVAATNQNLPELVEKGVFRNDLYHRISVATIEVPPLRQRREDIPLLAHHFLKNSIAFYDREEKELSAGVVDKLTRYDWPGNIRELKNVIASLVLTSEDYVINEWSMPQKGEASLLSLSLREHVGNSEKNIIISAMEKTGGNLTEAAELLKIPQRSLYDKMQKHSLNKEDYK